jgi:23S rRNA U2552 (ribose-2'-O)-methylase RlmE/FtsJ
MMNFFALSVMHKSAIPDIHFSFIGGGGGVDCDAEAAEKRSDSIIISESIYSYLCKSKETIETCNPDEWDSMKKYTNPYEFIHTAIPGQKCAISKLKPLSRSFYKMIEIIKHCKLVPYQPQQQQQQQQQQQEQHLLYPPIKTFHLAEGPGGFIEAVLYIRDNRDDVYHGMTLVDERSAGCPGWNKSRSFLERNPNVIIEYGQDGTGDLLSLSNYDACCAKYGDRDTQMEFISADGGFDFSSDFNNQEVLAQNLIVAEVLYAISLQKYEGSFVLKIFDIFTKVTVDLLQLLCSVYDDVIIFKPSTSRVANSEKYVVCKRFNIGMGDENARKELIAKFRKFFIGIKSDRSGGVSGVVSGLGVLGVLRAEHHSIQLLTRIEEINVILGQQQIENIASTVSLIQFKLYDRLEAYKRANVQKCITWCEKYNIPYNKGVVSTNTFIHS